MITIANVVSFVGDGLFGVIVEWQVSVVDFQAIDRHAGCVESSADTPCVALWRPASAFLTVTNLQRGKLDLHLVIPPFPMEAAVMMKRLGFVVPAVDVLVVGVERCLFL